MLLLQLGLCSLQFISAKELCLLFIIFTILVIWDWKIRKGFVLLAHHLYLQKLHLKTYLRVLSSSIINPTVPITIQKSHCLKSYSFSSSIRSRDYKWSKFLTKIYTKGTTMDLLMDVFLNYIYVAFMLIVGHVPFIECFRSVTYY